MLLVVLHHSFLIVPPESIAHSLGAFNQTVVSMRMPILFFLAGCMIPGSMRKGMLHYTDSKLRHALWPYLGWQAQEIVMLGSIWGLLSLQNWGPISELWFLFFVLVYYIIAPLGKWIPWWLLSLIGLLTWAVIPAPDLVTQLGFHATFFFAGAQTFGFVRNMKVTKSHLAIGAGLLIIPIAMSVGGVETYTWLMMVSSIFSIVALVILFTAMPENRFTHGLAWVGKRSVVYYVVHFPLFVYIGLLFGKLGLSPSLAWPLGLVITVALCTLIASFRFKMPVSFFFEFPAKWVPWYGTLKKQQAAFKTQRNKTKVTTA